MFCYLEGEVGVLLWGCLFGFGVFWGVLGLVVFCGLWSFFVVFVFSFFRFFCLSLSEYTQSSLQESINKYEKEEGAKIHGLLQQKTKTEELLRVGVFLMVKKYTITIINNQVTILEFTIKSKGQQSKQLRHLIFINRT